MVGNGLDGTKLGVLIDVRATIRRLVQALEAACQAAQLTEPQQHALLCVAHGEAVGEEITATTLQEHLATDKNTVADIVRRLEAHGLLTRQRQGRRLLLTLTPAGQDRFRSSLGTIGLALSDLQVTAATRRLHRQLDRYLAIYESLAGAADGSSGGC